MNDASGVIQVGPLEIHPAKHEVLVRGKPVLLTAMEMSILKLLAGRPGQMYSPEQIAEACHDNHTAIQPKSVNRRVQSLRQKLGEAGELITNMRGVGYSLQWEGSTPRHNTPWWMAIIPWPGLRERMETATASGWMTGSLVAGGAVVLLAGGMALERVAFSGVGFAGPLGERVELIGAAHWRPPISTSTNDPIGRMLAHEPWAGAGSSIAYLGDDEGQGDRYLVLGDRGYENGRNNAACRWHTFRITPGDDGSLNVEWLGATPLTDELGYPLSGGPGAGEQRYDPEALCIDRQGNVWIAEEYGPSIDVFNRDGRRIRRIAVPDRYRIARSHENMEKERRNNVTGRVPNRGFEAIALDEVGGRVFAMTQSPLIQDGGENGRFLRLLEMPISGETTAAREWVFSLEEEDHHVSEMLWYQGRLLVVERDTLASEQAGFKRCYVVDMKGATEIGDLESLPPDALGLDVTPVRKELAMDLLALARQGESSVIYEQFEGLCPGPKDAQGRRTFIITTDNGIEGLWLGDVMSVYALKLYAQD